MASVDENIAALRKEWYEFTRTRLLIGQRPHSVVGNAVALPVQDGKARVWSWLPREDIEDGAWEQITNLARLPNAFHVAIMPDCHKGYGMPIGAALATRDAVVPYAVGVDIGCGMVAVETDIPYVGHEPERVRQALERIYAAVPVGQPTKQDRNAGSHKSLQDSQATRKFALDMPAKWKDALRVRADYQLGTLGGGNHFIEIQTDGKHIWLMLHTGSRSLGYGICTEYHKRALENCERYHTPLPDKDLAFLPIDSPDGQDYMRDMGYAMQFAEESRRAIEARSLDAIESVFGHFAVLKRIETHHNFASVEKHLGQWVIVHRKGAVRTITSAGPMTVTIPGSMQTGSYIGQGLSSPLALNTCSHGAGRRLGRNAAKREQHEDAVPIRDEMAAQGIQLVCPPWSDVVDEAGFAYKDIENVMTRQSDLVQPLVALRPLGVVKG